MHWLTSPCSFVLAVALPAGGATWTRVLVDRCIQSLAVDPRNADLVYAGGTDHPYHDEPLGRGLMRSRDGGRTWESLNAPELTRAKIASITVDPRQPSRLYVCTSGNGMFVYEDQETAKGHAP